MDIQSCLEKIGYKAVVWGNDYEGIKPHELETKPIPSLAELEAIWPEVQAEQEKKATDAEARATLAEIDMKSIRAIREWVAAQETAPQFVKDYETAAVVEREKLAGCLPLQSPPFWGKDSSPLQS